MAHIANEQIKLHQYSLPDIIAIQAAAPINDHDKWQAKGGMIDEEGLWTNNGKVVAPVEILPWLAHMAHLNGHVCKRGTVRQVQESWYVPGIVKAAEEVCRSCQVCQQHNQQTTGKTRELGAHPRPWGPFCTCK